MRQSLIEGNVGSQLTRLTIPMIWGIFSLMAFELADTYFVGQLGTQELAAMSFTFPVAMVMGSVAMGLGIGASSVIARAFGEGDRARIQRLTTNSLTLALLVVVITVAIGLLSIDPLFTLMGADAETLPFIRDYMQIWYWGMLFLVIPMVGNSAIRAAGNSEIPGLIMTVAAVVNIILDPLFIFGFGTIPAMGLQGAALATVIGRATTTVASLLFLHLHLKMLTRPHLNETWGCWQRILHVGLPATGTTIITPISVGVITSFMASYGNEAVAGFGIASRLELFSLMTYVALSSSIGPFVGQNWGANQFERVRRAMTLSFRFCLIWGGAIALILFLFAPIIVARFDTNSNVIAIATNYLWIVPLSYAGSGILQITSATFNALANPLPSVILAATRMFGLYIPLAYFGSQLFALNGIFVAAAFANIAVGIGAYLWYQKASLGLMPTLAVEV